VRLPIQANLKKALQQANELLKKAGKDRVLKKYTRYTPWYRQIEAWRKDFPLCYQDTEDVIQSQYVIELLCKMTKGEAIITTGVGQHQMWAAQYYATDHPRSFLTSAGLGAMGFGYPAALGAKVAFPDKQVIDIDGDGSFLMNIQELAMAYAEGIAAKAIVLNNQHLGMVVQWEDLIYDSNRAQTYLGHPAESDAIYPDYVAMCQGFKIKCERVVHKKDLRPALQRMLDAQEPYVLDILVPYTEHVLPMIPAGMTYKDVITEKNAKEKTAAKVMSTRPSNEL